LAIGLQVLSGQLISIFSAVIIHKSIMAFSLGLTMAQSNLSKWYYLYYIFQTLFNMPPFNYRTFFISILIFSLASPIGMAMGIALTDIKKSLGRDIANGVLQGISGGTFLYITFFEVLPHELNKSSHRLLRVLFVLLGYSAICTLLFITH
jgi:zinc transporter 1/2/3